MDLTTEEFDLNEEIKSLGFIPAAGRILVKQKKIKKLGSIIIPHHLRKNSTIELFQGFIVATHKNNELGYKVGDEVHYGQYAGATIPFNGKDYQLMNEGDVLGVITIPKKEAN